MAVDHNELTATHRGIVKMLAPNSENEYLYAQSGLFTLDTRAEREFLNTGRFPVLDDPVIGQRPDLKNVKRPIIRLTLPVSQADKLLHLLWLENITRAHLMPTIDNVVTALKTKWRVENKIEIGE